MGKCQYCGGNDVEYSESRGETYCTQCGAVLEENRMVDSISFAETASGAVRACGQFIPASSMGGFAMSYGSRESREQALERGYNHIQRIADRLRLSFHLVEAAQRVYLMGVQRSFTMGRLSAHVAAASLYISCRREKTSQMLIDFSDVLSTPVKTLGAVFVKLLRVLHIQVPTIDPSLFMERFASQIPLGDKTSLVAQTGVRIVQAMARDWICTGRRPTGLCGSALLIAARYHGIKINADDISVVIRMSASTVNKRLSEFRETSTASIKSSDFDTTDLLALPTLTAPPCMRARERKTKRMALLADEEPKLLMDKPSSDDAQDTTSSSSSASSFLLSSHHSYPNTLFGSIRIVANENEICDTAPSSSSIASLAERILGAIEDQVLMSTESLTTAASTQDVESIAGELDSGKKGISEEQNNNDDNNNSNNNNDSDKNSKVSGDPEDALGELLRDVKEKARTLKDRYDNQITDENVNDMVENTSTAIVEIDRRNCEDDADAEERLSDVSDTEIDWMILSAEEKEAKRRIWGEMMKNVMPEVHRRLREKRRREKEQGTKKPKRRAQRLPMEPAASPAESVIAAFKNCSFSKRLSGDALNSLFSSGPQQQGNGNGSHNNNDSTYQSLFT